MDCPTNCSLYQRQPYPNFCTRVASRLQSRLASERLQNISYSLLLIRSQHTKLASGLHQKYGEITLLLLYVRWNAVLRYPYFRYLGLQHSCRWRQCAACFKSVFETKKRETRRKDCSLCDWLRCDQWKADRILSRVRERARVCLVVVWIVQQNVRKSFDFAASSRCLLP